MTIKEAIDAGIITLDTDVEEFWRTICRQKDWGKGHGTAMFHGGRSGQPLAVPLSADGVPIYCGMRLIDRNGDFFDIQKVWSESFWGTGGNPRVMVGAIPARSGNTCVWPNLFATAIYGDAPNDDTSKPYVPQRIGDVVSIWGKPFRIRSARDFGSGMTSMELEELDIKLA